MKSVMRHKFSQVPQVDVPRSTFDRSHGLKTSFDGGLLIPVLVDEIYPGDSLKCNMAGFARLSTPTFPIMDNMFLETFFFFVPSRQLWTNFRKFHGEQTDPGDSIAYTIPQNVVNNAANMSLADYFGIPTKVAANNSVNALPFRAYWHIYNHWFRDQNLIDAIDANWTTGDGPDTQSVDATADVLHRCKRHDYFTSCLPFLQKGDAVELSLGTEAPIYGKGMDWDEDKDADNYVQFRDAIGSSGALRGITTDGAADTRAYGMSTGSGTAEMYTDLTQATASTVNELRQSVQIQRLLERDARSGTRYPEIVKSHFGVTFPDITYRPEYLGGGSTPINITPVAQTDTAVGKLAGFGTAGFTGHGFVKSFTEHGYVIGLANVRADLTYQEGLDKMWSRSTRYDFYYPTLAHLGEQAVLNKEIYIDAADIGDNSYNDAFGYNERFCELKYKRSMVTGKMRSNDASTLDPWHLSIEFGATPLLDDSFIKDDPPIDRCIVTAAEPHFIMDAYFAYHHTRPMPTYSIPGFIDHF